MSLWIGTVAFHAGSSYWERAILMNSVTEKPLLVPGFRNEDEAEDFVSFTELAGFPNVCALGADTLDRLHAMWIQQREEDARLATEALHVSP